MKGNVRKREENIHPKLLNINIIFYKSEYL